MRRAPGGLAAPNGLCRVVIAVALAAVLAACGVVPQPLRPEVKPPDAPLVTPAFARTVVVLPVAGPNDLLVSDALAEAVANSLRRRDVPASVRGIEGDSGHLLTGYAELLGSGPASRLRLRWEMVDATGRPVGTYRQEQTVAARRWEDGDPALLRAIADGAAPGLVAIARGDAPPVQPPEPPQSEPDGRVARVHLLPVTGAPGNGDSALFAAMSVQLRREGLPMTTRREDADLLLRGAVSMGPPEAGSQSISIIWTALDLDGASLGEIRQANQIPAGSLDGAWGPVARLVARAAVGGLLDLMRRSLAAAGGADGSPTAEVPGSVGGQSYDIRVPGS